MEDLLIVPTFYNDYIEIYCLISANSLLYLRIPRNMRSLFFLFVGEKDLGREGGYFVVGVRIYISVIASGIIYKDIL